MYYLIKNAILINEMKKGKAHVLIGEGKIENILYTTEEINAITVPYEVIDGEGKFLIPGIIDDQVHFREPGLTHKGEIYTEAKAAVAGGVTSYMEMPNTVPGATTLELLEQKYTRASACSLANYSFFMGTSNDNLSELVKVDPKNVCGVKIFMGSSTGNMLVDNQSILNDIFREVKTIIALHCEDDQLIKKNADQYRAQYGEDVPMYLHPVIRDAEACYASSSNAVELATKHNTRIHILHISTAKELSLFRNDVPLREKRITSEACIHHLWFSDADYENKGSLIKWNPAVKKAEDREAIFQAVLDGRIDVIATDHAPHTKEEKAQTYFKAPSGGPLVQHSLNAMMEFYHQGKISVEMIVQKMCHDPAELFQVEKRGYIRKGYFADLVLVDPKQSYTVTPSNILYKCGWSPFEGNTFHSVVTHTFVNGHLVYNEGKFDESNKGIRLSFNR
jgi:dihydroorotase